MGDPSPEKREWYTVRLCPLCNEQDSWEHIVTNCPETERLRWQLLPERFLRSERGRLACWDLIWGYESEMEFANTS